MFSPPLAPPPAGDINAFDPYPEGHTSHKGKEVKKGANCLNPQGKFSAVAQ